MRKISVIPPVARRYASALFACASTSKVSVEIQTELQRIALCCSEPVFEKFLKNPLTSVSEQEAVIKEIGKRLHLSQVTCNFLDLVIKKRRLPFLVSMIQAYEECMIKADGSIRAEVVTAQPLSSVLKSRITELLGDGKKNIHISEYVDPSILGGIVLTLGNRLFDASLRTQLKDMYFAMKGIN